MTCAVLAWGEASRAAIFALPEPTFVTPAVDGWSPAPTRAPNLGSIELFKREEPWAAFQQKGTCGFFEGVSTSAFTCRQSSYVCATNTYFGIHGCCDPYQAAESCTLATTCMPKSLLSRSCDSSCSNNDFITKCTASANPECYEFQFVYTLGARTTTMKEYGCTDTATTGTIPLVPDGFTSSDASTSSSSASSTSFDTPTPSETPQQVIKGGGNPNNTPAIIGGVIGGLALVSALVFAIVFLLLRDRRRKREAKLNQQPQQHQDWAGPPPTPSMAEVQYNPDGFVGCNAYGEEPRSTVTDDDPQKNWMAWSRTNRDKKVLQDRVTSCGDGMYGAVETEGRMVHEAPT